MIRRADRVAAVIFDWAGTTVDYGCFAPVAAMIEAFAESGIPVTADQVRAFMGLKKRDHLLNMLELDDVRGSWRERYGSLPTEADADRLYAAFEQRLFAGLADYCEPVPGALETVAELRRRGIRIGSTTGYTRAMADVVAAGAKAKGYAPDVLVAADEVPAGRPAPYMCFRNMIALEVYPARACVKVGDTVSDIAEGLNAGMWSVGIVEGGSELGLTEQEVKSMPPDRLELRKADVRRKLTEAGADYVAESIGELPAIIDRINEQLQAAGSGLSGEKG